MADEDNKCKCCPECNATLDEPEKVNDTWFWIRDSKGYGSVTVTLLTVAFWVTTASYVFSLFEKIGPVQIRPFDVAACSAYFIPILTLYFGRKFTETRFGGDQK